MLWTALSATLALGACRCSPRSKGGAVDVTPGEPSMKTTSHPPAPSATVTETPRESGSACPAALASARRDGSRPNVYVAPSPDELRAARTALTRLLRGDAVENAAAFGFEVVPIEGWPDAVLLREAGDRRRGGGAYVVRKASKSKLVVQAPHTFHDEGTLPLACELFQRTGARALFINTVHRYKGAPAGSDGSHPSDVAHSPASLFQAATEGAVEAIPGIHVVQMHGFAERQPAARAVFSSGEKRAASPVVARVARALEGAVGPRVLRYPDDTNELGATKNVQGVVVRRAAGVFVHIEMDDGLRRELLRDASLRVKALDALGASLDSP
jgi:hypothetical protein